MKKIILFVYLSVVSFSFSQVQIGQDIKGESASDYSGYSISMPNLNTIAIGATHNDNNGTNAGHVKVYKWNGVNWTQKGNDIDGQANEDRLGWSVMMSDTNTIATGAPYARNSKGYVKIYSWNGVNWAQKGNEIEGAAAYDRFGSAISMPNANTIVVGASNHSSNSGHVRVYKWSGVNWTQKGNDINGLANGDQFGYSVSMPDTNTLAIGAIGNDGNGINAGHVRIYKWNGGDWTQKGNDINGVTADDHFGYSVSMADTNTVAIGAIGNDGNGFSSGHVRVYKWNGFNWAQKGNTISGEAAHDESGHSVSMPDINTVAIGATGNDGNGLSSGHVRVYRWNGVNWRKEGNDIDGKTAGDQAGHSVSMPNDSTLAIGSIYNDENGFASGHVRVYSLSNSIYFDSILITFACDSFLIPSGDSTLYASGTYFDTVNDTAYIIILTINNTVFNVDSMYFCNGDSISVSGIWFYDDTVIVDTLISVSGCDSIITYIISKNTVVPVLDLGANTILCQNDNLMLNAGLYDHYLWNTGDTSATILVDGTTLGTGSFIFWAEVFDTILDCSDRDSITINIVNCVNNEKAHYKSLISISPNPLINEKLTIDFGSFNEACFIDIFDASGKFIARSKRRENEKIKEIKLDQEKGIYFLKFTTNNESFSHKLIKE